MYVKNLGTIVFLSFATLAWASDPSLETMDTPPPEEVSPAIRESLGGQGLKALSGDEVVMELWLRSEVPIEEQARKDLGVSFGNLQQGTLIGVIRLPEEWSDYKNNPIAAGVYTLRYAIQPADGNHMGVDQWTLALELGAVKMGLVVEGHGEREGY